MVIDFSRCRSVLMPDGSLSPPFEHVLAGVRIIVEHPYFLLADDMGLSKTAQSIIAAQFLAEANIIDRVIVVAPASVKGVWYSPELGQLAEQLWMGATIKEYHQRIRTWEHEGPGHIDWIITNYEYIRRDANLAPLLDLCGPKTMLVCDESSSIKGYNSKQTGACMTLRWMTTAKGHYTAVPRCGRVLLLNGTPVANSPLDMFSQGNLMHPSILDCRYITHYKSRYAVMAPVMSGRGTPLLDKWNRPILTIDKWANLEDLQRRFAPYVLRREAKSLGIDFALPPVALTVTLTKETWKIYKSMRDELVAWLKSGDVAVTQTAAVKSMRLAQITSGFLGGVEAGAIEDDVDEVLLNSLDFGNGPRVESYENVGLAKSEKMYLPTRAISEVQEIGREKLDFALAWHANLLTRYPDLKLLTWCRFVPELRRYLAEVAKFGHPVGAVCGQPMLGGKKKDEREAALRLLHPKTAPAGPATVGGTYGTGALGLNFTACRTVLDMSYDFSPWKKAQGDARVNRPGQTGPVSFFYLVAVGPQGQATIDKHIIMHRLGKTDINQWTASAWVKALTEE